MTTCATCGRPVGPDVDEHYPHQGDCQLGLLGWCACSAVTHPDCCPDCNPHPTPTT